MCVRTSSRDRNFISLKRFRIGLQCLKGLFPFAEISRAIRIGLGPVGKAGFDGIVVDVFTMPQEALAVPDALVRKARLPDFKLIAQFFLGAIRKVSFNESDRLFNRLAAIESELQVEMVGHGDKVMQLEFFGDDIGSQNVDEEVGHAFGLQKRASGDCPRSHKKGARTVLDVVALCVARRPCHAQKFITSMMAWVNSFMRASRCCARAAAQEMIFFCALRHG